MSVNGITGVGTQFQRWNSTSSAWESIGGITNIGGPSASRDTHDTTALDTSGGYKTFVSGLRDSGEVTLSLIFDHVGYELLKGDFDGDDPQYYQIILPDTNQTSFMFQGLVTGLPLTIPTEVITYEATIKLSGEVTVGTGPGTPP